MAFEISRFPRSRLTEEAISKCWELLRKAIRMIDEERAYELSYEELYRNGYYIVQNKKGELLYKNVSATIQQIIHKMYEQLVDTSDEYLLEELAHHWEKHKRTMSMVKDILMYMNHNYCPKVGKPLINHHGFDLFLRQLLQREPIHSRFPAALLNIFYQARIQPFTDTASLAKNIKMLLELDVFGARKEVYEKLFEREFLKSSQAMFAAECTDYLAQHTISDYLLFVEKRLAQELDLCRKLLYTNTHEKLKSLFLQEAIEKHAHNLIYRSGDGDGGFMAFLRQGKMQEIRTTHQLFAQASAPCLIELQEALIAAIAEGGAEIMRDEKIEPHTFTLALFDLDEKYNDIVTLACSNDSAFRLAKKKAFQKFLNTSDRAARSLARYTDFLFRRQVRQLSDEQLEGKVNSTIRIFSNLNDKDIFEGFYRKALAKRLISRGGGLQHGEGERMMIARLKAECGPIFTKKLEVMLADLQASQDFAKEFRASRISKAVQGLEFHMRVLTAGNWPLDNQKQEVAVPKPLSTIMDVFTQFYLNKFAGRALNWKLTEGSADVRMIVAEHTKHELTVSTMQMCVLLLFNEKECFSLAELSGFLNVTFREIEAHVLPLVQLKLLLRDSAPTPSSGSTVFSSGKLPAATEEFKESVTLKLNASFAHRQYKIRVPGYVPKEEAETQRNEAVQRVLEDRGPVMDSVIVRIMKSRRQLHHNDLMSEVIKMLSYRFQPDPASIKKRIEALIDRDFIDRDPKDIRIYNYIA